MARQADVCPGLIYRWRRQEGIAAPGFAPVVVMADEVVAAAHPVSASVAVMEVEFANMRIRIGAATTTLSPLVELIRHHKAMDYMLKRWDAFARFVKDGRICLTNNAAERTLRGIAVGRKAWLCKAGIEMMAIT